VTDLLSLLPPNSTSVELVLEAAVSAAVDIDIPIVANARAETAAADHLPFLAWAFSVDSWDTSWASDVKRAAIASSVSIHRRKGTVGSVRDALTAFGYGDADIVEASRSPKLDAGMALDEGHRLHDLTHWASYAVYVSQPLRLREAEFLVSVLEKVAPARCRLQRIEARVNIALDEGYSLDEGWSLDTTFEFEVT
jgi:phage tail P2-like protein